MQGPAADPRRGALQSAGKGSRAFGGGLRLHVNSAHRAGDVSRAERSDLAPIEGGRFAGSARAHPPSAESGVFPDDTVAWARDPHRMSIAATDVEAQAIELAGFLARKEHDHHSPGTDGLKAPAPDHSRPRTAGERHRDLIIAALDRVLCLLGEAECGAVARASWVADDPPGWDDLTAREREVARRLAAGATDRDLASALGITLPTAKSHSKAVLAKLTLRSRHELRYVLPPSPKG